MKDVTVQNEFMEQEGDLEFSVVDWRETERRADQTPSAIERRTGKSRRANRGERQRQIDLTSCERSYSDDELEFMKAMDQYKRDYRRPFPTWSEALEVLRSIGYRKCSEKSQMPALSHSMPPNADA